MSERDRIPFTFVALNYPQFSLLPQATKARTPNHVASSPIRWSPSKVSSEGRNHIRIAKTTVRVLLSARAVAPPIPDTFEKRHIAFTLKAKVQRAMQATRNEKEQERKVWLAAAAAGLPGATLV